MINEFKPNAKYKGEGRAADLLERIYEHKKLTILGPLAVGAVVLVLFLIFGESVEKARLVKESLFLAALIYAGVLFVAGLQLFNPFCSGKSMDRFMLFATVGFGFGTVQQLLIFLFHIRSGFDIGLPGLCGCLSALALIQSKRK